MPRFHTIFDASTQAVKDIPFTSQEESDRDVEEAREISESASRNAESARIAAARLSGVEKLKVLGLTNSEISALTKL